MTHFRNRTIDVTMSSQRFRMTVTPAQPHAPPLLSVLMDAAPQQRSPPLLPLYHRHRVGKAHTHQVQKLQSTTPEGRHPAYVSLFHW
jgi:hypothetical protein